jgi:SAM-dependent methyltransferase
MFKEFRLYISPAFLSRGYKRRDVKDAVHKFKFDGNILDYGCGQKPYADLFAACDNYVGIDLRNYSANLDMHTGAPDYFFGKDYFKNFKLPFASDKFDHCVSFQVLEHHIKPHLMIAEIARVTKKGGLLLLTAPFLGGLHEEPHDYQRFTKYGLIALLNEHGYEVKYIKEQGSLFSTAAMLMNEYWGYRTSLGGIRRRVAHLIYAPFLAFSYLAFILDKFIKTDKIVFNYLVVAQKVSR